jgi:hypothetical protein
MNSTEVSSLAAHNTASAKFTRLTCIVCLLVLSNCLLSVGRTSIQATVSHGEPPLVTDTSTLGLVIGAGEFSGAVLTLAKTAPFFYLSRNTKFSPGPAIVGSARRVNRWPPESTKTIGDVLYSTQQVVKVGDI